jgi:hypothetical protein
LSFGSGWRHKFVERAHQVSDASTPDPVCRPWRCECS